MNQSSHSMTVPPSFIHGFTAGAALLLWGNLPSLSAEPWLQQAYIKSSNGDGLSSTCEQQNLTNCDTNHLIGDYFGYAVAVSGDLMVVGAPYEDSDATDVNGDEKDDTEADSGAAYVFARRHGVWIQEAYLKAPGGIDPTKHFGRSVAISGEAVAVGETSAVYVFRKTAGQWRREARVQPPHSSIEDQFAVSLAMSGDTIVAGAPEEDSAATGVNGDAQNNGSTNSGAAYVFVRTGTGWTQQAYLKASNTGARDYFGNSVSISGQTIAVGAWSEDSSATGVNGNQSSNGAEDAGAVYVFQRTGETWSQQAYLKASNTGGAANYYDYGDYFGRSVALSGDTLLVGASGEDSSAAGVNGSQTSNGTVLAGAAYVFVRSGGMWSQEAYLKASNPGQADFFGYTVALSGNTAVVGAYREDSSARGINGNQGSNGDEDSGAVYIFRRFNGQWAQQAYVKSSNSDTEDQFGRVVAACGNTVVAGAAQEDSDAREINGDESNNSRMDVGAAYVFMTPPPPPVTSMTSVPGGLRFALPRTAGYETGMQYSPSLASGIWTDIGSFTGTGVEVEFTETNSTRLSRPQGFYRAFYR